MKKTVRIHPVLGVLGLLGILGFYFEPIFCVFFGFFGFFWWGLLCKEKADERLEKNIRKSQSIVGRMAVVLCFFLLFALDRNIQLSAILFWGSIAYAALFVLAPAIAYICDKRG